MFASLIAFDFFCLFDILLICFVYFCLFLFAFVCFRLFLFVFVCSLFVLVFYDDICDSFVPII